MALIDFSFRALCATLLLSGGAVAADSAWVFRGLDGKLIYRTTSAGDRIMDFSYAGYKEGGAALPDAVIAASLATSGDDDTEAIQAAIDRVAALATPDSVPRALLLRAGAFHLSATLRLPSRVVLRGQGDGNGGTVLVLTGAPHLGLQVGGTAKPVVAGPSVSLSDAYIASGASIVHIRKDAAFKPGDRVQIAAPVTAAWVKFMGMDALSRNGAAETWLSGTLAATRTIVAVERGSVLLKPALSHAYDTRYFGPHAVQMAKVDEPGLAEEAGVENLRIIAPPLHVKLNQPFFTGIAIDGIRNFWIRNVSISDTTNDVEIGRYARQGTIEQVTIKHSVTIVGNAEPFAFGITGSQILIDRCKVTGDNIWYAATHRDVQGPNVVLNSRFEGTGAVEPHQRWATGLLIDGVQVPDGRIAFQNRGEMGTGHGWTVGWSVSWNNAASSFLIQNPPGTLNWSIGDSGPQTTAKMPTFPQNRAASYEPQGLIEQSGHPVSPRSLYLAQLEERLGPAALRATGY